MTADGTPSRRRFLLGTGSILGTAGLAGCGIPGGGDGEEEEEDNGGEEEEDGGGEEEEEEQLQPPEST